MANQESRIASFCQPPCPGVRGTQVSGTCCSVCWIVERMTFGAEGRTFAVFTLVSLSSCVRRPVLHCSCDVTLIYSISHVLQDGVWNSQLHRPGGAAEEGSQLRGGLLGHWLHHVSHCRCGRVAAPFTLVSVSRSAALKTCTNGLGSQCSEKGFGYLSLQCMTLV